MNAQFHDWMTATLAEFEVKLAELLPAVTTTPTHLHEAMCYAALDGGKRVRPLLVFASGRLFDAPS